MIGSTKASSRRFRTRRKRRVCWPLLVLLLAAFSAHAESVYRCVDAHGATAFQATPCGARARQAEVELRQQPLIDADAPVATMSSVQMIRTGPAYHLPKHSRARRSDRVRSRKQAISWECRASDGEVFYRHARCPHSVRGDGIARSDDGAQPRLTRSHGKRARIRDAWSPVPVSARKVSRADACRQINAAAAVDRDGHARDEQVSVYDHNVGRDPCSGY